jgi:type IV pilus assembly protein PilQ
MVLALIILGCAVAVAEENLPEVDQKEVLTALDQRLEKTITVNFKDTDIDEVIGMIAEQADVDIIKSPKVAGTVTAKLTEVPLSEALRNILAAHGWGFVTDRNIIRIAPQAELAQAAEALVSKIWRLNYANVKEVELALKNFISRQGTVSSNPGTSNIIVTDTESKIKAIDTFIDEIDRITPQILVEVRIYDITSKEALDLGIEWFAGTRTSYDPVTGIPDGFNRDPFIGSQFSGATSKTEDDVDGLIRFGWLNDSIDIDAVLRAQQRDINAKLLANPRILVLDNEQAVFDIITENPYVERTITGVTVTETIKFKEVGVKLVVTPHVTRERMLRLHLAPEFGVVIDTVDAITSNVPVVDTRRVDTIALVRDGQTVALGGLRKKGVTQQINKVPLLGDLPLVGLLFRFTGENTTINELVIFITPRIVEQPALLSEAERKAYEMTDFGGPRIRYTEAEKSIEAMEESMEE